MDTETLRTLEKLYQPHMFAPLGNGDYFASLGVPEERTHIMDWWESKDVVVNLNDSQHTFIITCTPCQHFTGRGIFDRFKTLWASWAVTDPSAEVKVWFGGDTAYRTVRDGEDEEEVPVCPEFKKIGEIMGPFDLAFIPIGYGVRFRM
jgi:N-acyl-phosphatidylethanolamine-hydrolysing phospholipase D